MVLLLQWKILLVVTLVIFLLLLLGVGGGVALLLKSNLEEPDDRQEAGKFLMNKFWGGFGVDVLIFSSPGQLHR